MSRFFRAMKQGLKAVAEGLGPGPYAVAGRQVRCGHCQGMSFSLRHVPSQGVGGVLPMSGHALVCVDCGSVALFDRSPDRL